MADAATESAATLASPSEVAEPSRPVSEAAASLLAGNLEHILHLDAALSATADIAAAYMRLQRGPTPTAIAELTETARASSAAAIRIAVSVDPAWTRSADVNLAAVDDVAGALSAPTPDLDYARRYAAEKRKAAQGLRGEFVDTLADSMSKMGISAATELCELCVDVYGVVCDLTWVLAQLQWRLGEARDAGAEQGAALAKAIEETAAAYRT